MVQGESKWLPLTRLSSRASRTSTGAHQHYYHSSIDENRHAVNVNERSSRYLTVTKNAATQTDSIELARSRDGSIQSIYSITKEPSVLQKPPPKTIVILPSPDRTVQRSLKGIHIFMITINATLGTGLYWRGGQVLELGGPLAVVLSFLFVGILSWSVMQCVSEMLCIWPIPGALSVYVSELVDFELGIAVGVSYWFTYSMSFSTSIATSAAEFNFWLGIQESTGIQAGVLYLLIPLAIVCANALPIKIYGALEVFTGTIKLLFLGIIICTLIAINRGVGLDPEIPLGFKYWKSPVEYDSDAAENWFSALLMGLSIATFSFVGIEIVAACALEAKWPRKGPLSKTQADDNLNNDTLIGNTVKFSARYISVLAMVLYVIAAFLISLDIERDDCELPRVSWISGSADCQTHGTRAAFVAIALNSGIPHLADVFNVFLIFTCLTCTGTNLYVASRTLFGLTSGLEGGDGQRWYLRILAWFGKTNSHQVPIRAVVFSALAFWWVPFLQLIGEPETRKSINMFVEMLSQMASMGVLIVWACNCVAFIRYYHCLRNPQNQKIFRAKRIPQFQRDDSNEYPYKSHGQPLLAYLAFAGCLFILIVAGGASLWKGFHLLPFLGPYLTIFVFLCLWILLKVARKATWKFVDLSDGHMVANKLQKLHDIRGATQI